MSILVFQHILAQSLLHQQSSGVLFCASCLDWAKHRLRVTPALPAAILMFGEPWAKHNGCTKAEIPLLCRVAAFISNMLQLCPGWNTCCEAHEWQNTCIVAGQVGSLPGCMFAPFAPQGPNSQNFACMACWWGFATLHAAGIVAFCCPLRVISCPLPTPNS